MRAVQIIRTVALSDGGPAEAAIRLNEALNARPDVTITCLTWDDSWEERESGESCALLGRSLSGRRHPLRALLTLWREIRFADVAYIQGVYVPVCLGAALICLVARRPYAFHAHGAFEPYEVARQGRKRRLADTFLVSHLCHRSHAVIFDSDREAASALVAPPRSRVVELGGAPALDVGERSGCQVLFLGRVARKKRVDLLLEAWPQVVAEAPGAVLVIAGPDDEGIARAGIQAMPSVVRRSVTVAGVVSGAAKAELLLRSSVFVLPSENENFAIGAAEAAGFGLALVLSSGVALTSLFRDHGAVLEIDTLSVECVASALRKVVLDSAFRTELSKRSTRLARERLTWSAAADRLLVVLTAAVDVQGAERRPASGSRS